MTKVVKEFLLDNATGEVDIEYSDNSTLSYSLANAVTAIQSGTGLVFSKSVPIPVEVAAALPSELSGLTLAIQGTYLRKTGISNMSFDAAFPGWQSWQVFWTDPTAVGNGSGATQASPFDAPWKGVQAANATGNPAVVMVPGGTTAVRTKSLTNSGSVLPTVPIIFMAHDGRPVVGAHEDLTWAVDGTITTGTVSKATRSNGSLGVDLLSRNDDGTYQRLALRASAADVGRFSGYYTDNASVWVSHPSGAAVSNANTRIYIAVDNVKVGGTAQVSVAFIGRTAADGFDFEGGQAGCLRVLYTAGGSGARSWIWARNCTFRYGGHTTGAVGNIAIEGLNGNAVFQQCDWGRGATDGLNVHNALGATKTVLYTENCSGRRFGETSAYVSNNFWTLHDNNVLGIDLCSEGWDARGVSAHIINNSVALLAGTRLHRSVGDVINGGANPPCEVKAQDAAKLFLFDVQTDPVPGGFAFRSEGTAAIKYRDCMDLSGATFIGPTASASEVADW